jgi:hypothetical protein
MKSYDPPAVPENMAPADAQAQLDRIHADAQVDHDHPAFSRVHPQAQSYRGLYSKLHEIVSRDASEKKEAKDAEATAAFVEQRTARDQAMRQEVEEDAKALKALGYEGDLPERLEPWQGPLLKAQRAAAEGRHGAAIDLIEQASRGLGFSSDSVAMLRQYAEMKDADPGLRQEIFDKVIGLLNKAGRERFGKKPNTKENDHGLHGTTSGSGSDDQAAGGSDGTPYKTYGRRRK